MFNITCHQISKPNFNITSYLFKQLSSKRQQMIITGKYVEKKNPQELLVGLKFVVATVQNDMEIPQKI